MRSHLRNNRRNRGHKEQEDEHYLGAQGDEARSETYPRLQEMPHHDEGYRPSSTSQRPSYDTNREASTSRNQRSESWRRTGPEDPYVTNDGYHHHGGGRDDHDVLEARDADGWTGRTQTNARYPNSRNDWAQQRYEHGYGSSSYAESSSRNHHNVIPRDNRNSSYDQWTSDDSRGDDHHGMAAPDDGRLDREAPNWRPDQRRDKGGQKFQSDSGWGTRRAKTWDDTWEDPQDKTRSVVDDRSWEPAPSWQPSGQGSHGQHNRNGQRGNHANRNFNATSKGGKRVIYSKPKRDWRNDDGTLNNWPKRDAYGPSTDRIPDKIPDRAAKPPIRRKHPRSTSRSRSRSRSPVGSYYSRRSSWDRSRSRSISPQPKRRRREASPPVPRSRTPSDRGRTAWVPSARHDRESISPRRSPASHLGRTPSDRGRSVWPTPSRHGKELSVSPRRSPASLVGRRRSISSVSSISTERSVSRSPSGRTRAVHRLPSLDPTTSLSPNTPSRKGEHNQRNGKAQHQQTNGKHNNGDRRKSSTSGGQGPEIASMPPPTIIPPAYNSRSMYPPRPAPPVPFAPPPFPPSMVPSTRIPAPPRFTPGFKPLSQTSSLLKKFFPGDDDDMDLASDDPVVAPPPSTETIAEELPRRSHSPPQESARSDVQQYKRDGRPVPPESIRPEFPQYEREGPTAQESVRSDFQQYERENRPTPKEGAHFQQYERGSHTMPQIRPGLQYYEREGRPTPPENIRPDVQEYDRRSGSIPQENTRPNFQRYERENRPSVSKSAEGSGRYGDTVPPLVQEEPSRPPTDIFNQTPRSNVREIVSSAIEGSFDLDSASIPSTPIVGKRRELYKILTQVGEGTFGKVYKAQNTITKAHVALKRIRMESEKDGFPVTAMREIKLLQSLQHPNIVQLYEMMVSNGDVYMVFEYSDHDLTGILSQTQFNFADAHLKSLCHQMLAGLAYLHHKGVVHRDIKGSNILINNRGELKLADFGLARFYQKRRRTDYTNRVITLWYRPPELLFGATVYGPEVDMWSAGCIMLELFTKKPVFQGDDEINQLDVIYKIIGTPTPERWAGIMDLPWYELVKPKEAIPNRFRELFQKWMSPAALDLAERLLAYNPSQRATAIQAMDAPYFLREEPRASLPAGLATLDGEWHELETKRERARKKKKPENAVQ